MMGFFGVYVSWLMVVVSSVFKGICASGTLHIANLVLCGL